MPTTSCDRCGNPTDQHDAVAIRGRNVNSLVVLCEDCEVGLHEAIRKYRDTEPSHAEEEARELRRMTEELNRQLDMDD